MYTSEVITSLAETVGFGDPIDNSISLSSENEMGSHELLFSSYHRLVTVENLVSTFDSDIAIDDDAINAELEQIRLDAARKVLAEIFDSYPDYVEATDYSQVITDRLVLLRKAFAYQVAVTCLEGMAASKRFNLGERSIKESFGFLKIELEGTKNDYGKRISHGIKSYLLFAISDAKKVIWAVKPTIQNSNSW